MLRISRLSRPSRLRLLLSMLGAAALSASFSVMAQDGAPVKDTIAQRAMACAACHGEGGRATRDGYYPRIAGKPAGYLYNQLIHFREGRRQSAPMRYMVEHLSDDYLRELADYFASQQMPYPALQIPTIDAGTLERGRQLVLRGDAARKLPACVACHGAQLTGAAPGIPGLLGLPRDYINAQFGAWKNGSRRAAAPDCMGHIARQLTQADIGALSSWLAAQPVPAKPAPVPAAPLHLPLACGSAPGPAR
jgi:cytochrome c553